VSFGKLLGIFVIGFAFIFLMSLAVVHLDMNANPWLLSVGEGTLNLLSRPALLYLYQRETFWLQTALFALFGSAWVTFYISVKKRE